MNYRGKRLFAGRLFAGRLWGPPEPAAGYAVGRSPRRPRRVAPTAKRRRDTDDDVLLFLLR